VSDTAFDSDRFGDWLASWTDELVGPYIERLITRKPPFSRSKDINDPVCGTILLRPAEVLLLDSPLMQRLRRIRQLGVAHLVYPSAVHTRFEHSLGVLYQVQQLILAVNRFGRGDLIAPDQLKLLRFTALCHDIGHGLLSHVSESALSNFRVTDQLRTAFQSKRRLPSPTKISEIAAYYMVRSRAFHDLLKEIARLVEDPFYGRGEMPEMISEIIVGQVIADDSPLLQELITGPFDADKLDYMNRDAYMCGVPSVPDVHRMVQKIRAVRATLGDLPIDLQERVKAGLPAYLVIGIAQSGAQALDELAVGRALLSDKIYRHQKVRAAESMVAAVVHQIGPLLKPSALVLPYLLTDDELLNVDLASLRRLIGKTEEESERQRVAVALDLIKRLKNRDLFVRAFAFAQRMPLDPYAKDPDQHIGIASLIMEARARQPRGALVTNIANEVRKMLELLGADDAATGLPTADLSDYIWLDPPAEEEEIPVSTRAMLIDDDGRLMRYGEPYGETPGWADAYVLTRDLAYLFTVPELAPYVYLAAERVVRLEYEVRVPTSMISYSKQDRDVVDRLRRKLADKAYYAGAPYELRPEPYRLTRGDVPGILHRVASAVTGYSPPTDTPDNEPLTVDEERIRDWVRQFEDDGLIDSALKMVSEVRLIGRRETTSAVDRFIREHREFHGASLAVLGSPKDSSAVSVYWAHDAAREFELEGRSLERAITEDRPIVFVDDFIGTGWQAGGIVANWFGEEPPENIHEARGDELVERLRERFRSNDRVAFLFVSGKPEGSDYLTKVIQQVGLTALVHIDVPATSLPRAFGKHLYGSDAAEEAFLRRCRAIGLELLTEPNIGHDASWAEKRALGYGNDAFLVLFPNNTPSATVTCLWRRGTVDGIPWMPLFPRRQKQ